MTDYTIYSKFCVKCVAKESLEEIEKWCDKNNKTLEVERTTYRPEVHKIASAYWGDQFYTMFVRDNNTGDNVEIDEFVKKIKENDKPKTIKKAKPVKKGGDNGTIVSIK